MGGGQKAESLGNPLSQSEKWPRVPPQDFPLEGEVPHAPASSPGRGQPRPPGRAPNPPVRRPRFTEGTPGREGARVWGPCRPGCTARTRLEASACLSSFSPQPRGGKTRPAGCAGRTARRSCAGEGARTAPGSASPAPSRPLGRRSPARVWISVRRCEPPAPPLPPCPVQIHPQTCAQPAGMRQWLPDVDANA